MLTNPPFGTKKGGERATRDDLTFPSSNKQLNFLQHIYRSLKRDGKARAAVVLPDNVLFADGDGGKIRADSVLDYNDLQDPAESGEAMAAQLEEAVGLIRCVVEELRGLKG